VQDVPEDGQGIVFHSGVDDRGGDWPDVTVYFHASSGLASEWATSDIGEESESGLPGLD
jgi:hypothetical protein